MSSRKDGASISPLSAGDEDIKPGQTPAKTYSFPYNNADVKDQRVRPKGLVDMRVVWNPKKNILENGRLLQ